MADQALFIVLILVAIGVPTIALMILRVAIIRYSSVVTKAGSQELFREDDVLLQSTALSQTILYFLINLTLKDEKAKMFLGGVVITFAVAFYSIRALAKIKNKPKFRYYSMYLFSLLAGNTAGIVALVMRNRPMFTEPMPIFPDLYLIGVLPFFVYDILLEFTKRVLKKRYGCQ